MPARSRTKGQSAIVVACVLLVFGCGSPSGVPDFVLQVSGVVLEYTDATRTTTRPVNDAWVGVILPDGEVRHWCDFVDCYNTNFVFGTFTFTDTRDNSPGHYTISLDDPAHCTLRVRAWEQVFTEPDVAPNLGDFIYTYSGKTATSPRLATDAQCQQGFVEDGPTLIIE